MKPEISKYKPPGGARLLTSRLAGTLAPPEL